MANKRMFTMKICDSDAFLDMPLSTQCLYFHLNMRADDDGFIGNPKRVARLIGASEDDLNLLIAKRFLLMFEDGVIVIKHWRMHNTLAKNRYHETQYLDEKRMLKLKENGSYSFDSGKPLDDSLLIDMFKNSDSKKLIGEQAENKRRTSGEHSETADIDLGLDIDIDLDLDKELDKGKDKDIDVDKGLYIPHMASSPASSGKKKPSKKTFGEFKHVKLTEDELERLQNDYGSLETDEAIKYLDEYIEMKGTKYKNHNLVLRKWVFDAVKEKNHKKSNFGQTSKNRAAQELDDFYQMANEWANERSVEANEYQEII